MSLQNNIILDVISNRKIDKHFVPRFVEMQYCNDGQNKRLRC